MSFAATQITVPDRQSLDAAITSYIAQGFAIQNRGENFAVMFKKKEFSVVWAVVGLIVCLLPLFVYLIVYATQKDQLVEIRIVGTGSEHPAEQRQRGGFPGEADIPWSDDGEYWWDGVQWRAVRGELPPGTHTSPDGEYFYDGRQWRPMPAELRTERKNEGGQGVRKVITFDPEEETPPS